MSLVTIILCLAGAWAMAWAGSKLAARLGLPGVLAELLAGIVLANLPSAFGGQLFRDLSQQPLTHQVSESGVLLLLFTVGLEIDFADVARTGRDALLVATLGVAAPFALAFVAIPLVAPMQLPYRIFIATTLVATSVGITARVLRDLGKLGTASGHLILGAAVIDDVFGIVILAIVTSFVSQGVVSEIGVLWLLIKVLAFFGLCMGILRPAIQAAVARLPSTSIPVRAAALALGAALFLGSAEAAMLAGLSAFIGTFVFGLALPEREPASLAWVMKTARALSFVAVPLFFVSMGLQVRWEALSSPASLALTAVLMACAVAGKMACALGVTRRSRGLGADRALVALGMIPRGEVGLIFAEAGIRTGVLQGEQYASVLSVAFLTTLISPSLLSWRARRL
jgi:Kef-type K+ transport system membrane component KefB